LTRNMHIYIIHRTLITSLYEGPVYRSYGLHGSKYDDDYYYITHK